MMLVAFLLLLALLSWRFGKFEPNRVHGFDPVSLFVQLAIGLAIAAVGYALTPKPKRDKPAAAADLEAPTSEAGIPIAVVFGTKLIKGPNILWYGEKGVDQFEVDV